MLSLPSHEVFSPVLFGFMFPPEKFAQMIGAAGVFDPKCVPLITTVPLSVNVPTLEIEGVVPPAPVRKLIIPLDALHVLPVCPFTE